MNGQWLGYLTNFQKDGKILDIQQSFVVLNLDINGESFEGRVMLFSLNRMVAQVKINKKDFDQGKFTGKLSGFNPIREDTTIGSWEEKEFSNIPKTEIPETGEFGGISGKSKTGESVIIGRFKAGKTYEGKCYLKIFDLPVRDRAKAMIDLHEMDITAASLFRDLDGICKALKEKHF